MWKDVVLITLSCTLFVQMGLSDAVQNVLRVHFRPLSCPKCLTFWLCLLYMLLSGVRVLDAVAASFLFSYVSLWLALALDALASAYNRLYEQFSETPRAPEDAASDTDEARADEVPEV